MEETEIIGEKEKGFDFAQTIKPEIIEVPNYDYGRSQQPLDYKLLRNKENTGGKIKTGHTSIPGGYTNYSITGLGFTPKAIQIIAQTSNKVAWGYGEGASSQRCIYFDGTGYGNSSNRLFRFDGPNVGDLVSIDTDGFTVKSDLDCILIWTCFG